MRVVSVLERSAACARRSSEAWQSLVSVRMRISILKSIKYAAMSPLEMFEIPLTFRVWILRPRYSDVEMQYGAFASRSRLMIGLSYLKLGRKGPGCG